jgi:hypothetical protein
MKTIILFIALLALVPGSAAAAQSGTTSTSVSVMPGPFTTTLTVDDGVTVLTIIDATGSGHGWWVTVECTCDWSFAGDVRDVSSETEHLPHWDGTALVAGRGEGMGTFSQAFVAAPGQWIVSASQGERP